MEWLCNTCNAATDHDYEYIADASKRPKTHLSVKLTCNKCKSIDWGVDEIFDEHVCSGSGNWCYCNDTMHQHCTQCDSICNTNPDYEP